MGDFDKHLDTQKSRCGPKSEGEQHDRANIRCEVRPKFSWIKNSEGSDIVSTDQNLAVDLVKKRASELMRQEWLGDRWGYSAVTQARRQSAESRREWRDCLKMLGYVAGRTV